MGIQVSMLTLSYIIILLTFMASINATPVILREAEVYGSAVIGLSLSLATLFSLLLKTLGVRVFMYDLAKVAFIGAIIMAISFWLYPFGPLGFALYAILNDIGFMILVVVTLIMVAEYAEENKLGFAYGVRGAVISLGAVIGSLMSPILYSMGVIEVLITSTLLLIVVAFMSLRIRARSVQSKGKWSFRKRWLFAYLSSLFVAGAFQIISTYLPPYHKVEKVPYLYTSLFYTARGVAGGALRIPAGVLSDLNVPVYLLAPFFMIGASLAAIHSSQIYLLSPLAGVLVGSAWGISSPKMLSIASREEDKRSSMSFYTTNWDIASIVFLPLAGFIASWGYEYAFFLSLILSAIAIPFYFKVWEQDRT